MRTLPFGKSVVADEADEHVARCSITQLYSVYQHTPKDELLLHAKKKRKAFIQQINAKPKPLGFRKKENTWTYALDDCYDLMFNVQKSSFADEYYLNIGIGRCGTTRYGDCYATRITPNDQFSVDWQTLGKESLDLFLDERLIPALQKIMNTVLTELGQISECWEECHCDRQNVTIVGCRKTYGKQKHEQEKVRGGILSEENVDGRRLHACIAGLPAGIWVLLGFL